jgi:hypothetical protein
LGKRNRAYGAEKRRKELKRQQKQAKKRAKRQGKADEAANAAGQTDQETAVTPDSETGTDEVMKTEGEAG